LQCLFTLIALIMGKGDIKTAKGKRVRGSYGVTRKRKKKESTSKDKGGEKTSA